MEENARRESSKFCSTSGRARRLRDVHPGDLFLMTSKNFMKEGCELKQSNHLQDVASFPKRRRAAAASAPATMGKVSEGQALRLPARTTAVCCTPTSVLCHSKDVWPASSADSRFLPEGQLITGVYPTRGLFSGTPQARETFLPVLYGAGSLPCRSNMPARLVEEDAIGQPYSKPGSYIVPAASATGVNSTRSGVGSVPGVSATNCSTQGWERSQTPVWPQRSASHGAGGSVARASPQNSAIRPEPCVAKTAMSQEELTYMPAKGKPLRLCLADWGLPFAINQVHPLPSSHQRLMISHPSMASLCVQATFKRFSYNVL